MYQIGGSLTIDNPFYVPRKADIELYENLKNGDFSYVLNSRQMGKSSLLVRAKHQLEEEGFICTTLDLTNIGSENITPLQWYKGIVAELWRGFKLSKKLNLKNWWNLEDELSLLQRLNNLIEELLLVHYPQNNLVIFVDEIDSILSLNFSVDDFFALIRYCYNQRAINSEYHRLTFAIFGVATPADLIKDKKRTPFNIGKAIELDGFQITEVTPLIAGLVGKFPQPELMIKEVLHWSNGQPFLTQKICELITVKQDFSWFNELHLPDGCAMFLKDFIYKNIIHQWESQDEPEHLKTIRDRLLYHPENTGRLLGFYQQILEGTEISSNDSWEQIELILSGLVYKNQGLLKIKNPIYKEVFNRGWVEKQLENLRPYSQSFNAWIKSQQEDKSRLLRGQALKDAQNWSHGKNLSDGDYQYLSASVELENKEIQLVLEGERSQEIAARLVAEQKRLLQEQKTAKLQRLFIGFMGLALMGTVGLSTMVLLAYRSATISEIKALISSAQGSFDSDRHLEAIIQVIKAKSRVKTLAIANSYPDLNIEIHKVLKQTIYGADEFNRLVGHESTVLGVSISPDGKIIATSSADTTVKLWKSNGELIKTIKHSTPVIRVKFSPDSQIIAAASLDGIITLMQNNGTLIKRWKAHSATIWDVSFSSNGIISASGDNTLKLWKLDGTLITTLTGHQAAVRGVVYHQQKNMIISGSLDDTMKFWRIDGTLIKTIKTNSLGVSGLNLSADGQMIAASNNNKTLTIWTIDGTLIKRLKGTKVVFNSRGNELASVEDDQNIKIREMDGKLLNVFQGHRGFVWDITFSPQGDFIASASADNTVKLWKLHDYLRQSIYLDNAIAWGVNYSPDGRLIAFATNDKTIKIFNSEGNFIRDLKGHEANVNNVAFSPDSKFIASTSEDQTIKLWQTNGKLIRTFKGHTSAVSDVVFSPDGQTIASGGDDQTIKLWNLDGKLIKTWQGHEARVYRLRFSSDGKKIVSVGADGAIAIWNMEGKLIKKFIAEGKGVWGLAVKNDLIASGSFDGTIQLWQWDGKLLKTIKGHKSIVPTLDFSEDGKWLVSASSDNTVKLWKMPQMESIDLSGHQGAVWGIKFSPDGKKLISSSAEPAIFLWNIEKITHIDDRKYACDWVRNYLKTNQEVHKSDRDLCD